MKDVLLCSTLHDPKGVFLDELQQASKTVLEGYKGWVVNVTTATDQRVKDMLHSLEHLGVIVTETDEGHPVVEDKIENDHLFLLKQTIAVAEELECKKIQYTDGDRIITAAVHYPQDFHHFAKRASELITGTMSYVNFRRSVEDYFSHHPPLVETEFEFNRLYSEVFGIILDIGSTAHGMSIDVVREILHRSPQMELVSFPHPKWMLIAKEMGVKIRSEETKHVLTFETPDQFKKEVKERITAALLHDGLHDTTMGDSYEKLQHDYMATIGLDSTRSPREWDLRFNTERQYLTVLSRYLSIFGKTPEREKQLRNEIDQSLVTMEGRHTAIREALQKSPEEIHRTIREKAEHAITQTPFDSEKK